MEPQNPVKTITVDAQEVAVYELSPTKRYVLKFKHYMTQTYYEQVRESLKAQGLESLIVLGPNCVLEDPDEQD